MFHKSKIIRFILILSLVFCLFTLNVYAADEELNPTYEMYPYSAGYYVKDGTIGYRTSAWVYDTDDYAPAHVDFNIPNTGDIPVTYFFSLKFDPSTIKSGYIYALQVNFKFISLVGDFQKPDTVLKLNDLYFANHNGNSVYQIPPDNIVSRYTANYVPALNNDNAYVNYRCWFYLDINQDVYTNMLTGPTRAMFIEIPAYMVNSTRLEVSISELQCTTQVDQNNFNNFVANRIADMDRVNKEMSQNIRTGFADMQSAIDDMPLSEYDFANGRFGRDAQNGIDELFGSWSDKFTGIIATAQSSMTSLYNAISTHDADFCIIMPDSKVPIFEDLKIYEQSGLIRLEDMLPDGVYAKFEDVLPVVRGVISVTAVFGLLWWCIPKNLLGGDKD